MQQLKNAALIRAAMSAADQESFDPDTRVACWLISPTTSEVFVRGYNTFPRSIDNMPARWERPAKYKYVVHAEANAVATAARNGKRTDGLHAVLTLFPCSDCCKLLIQAGIAGIIVPRPDWSSVRWRDKYIISKELLKESGISVQFVLPELL